ncbi:flagellar hook protein FlgE [Candidatus Aerophobetes bacterium]|uniref:Flagellar hook protein FlgE n=1 Tax=Aerophobetes bacterium TaxID=2030807 RepID=A0A662DAU6_UNCAE|nr:MAG: flagellar hook protein FlgE [Candidatus Aerophobetes bacterium]
MMRSLYSGVSGLRNHQIRMDVLGNNIANVNTYGFKKSRVSFQDILSQTISGASAPTAQIGGVNPKQVGLGMTVASIDRIFTQGSLQTTGLNLDTAIQGDGFFILKKGDETFYTRAGGFGLDKNGTLVNPANGFRVQGWRAVRAGAEYIIDTTADVEDIIIPIGGKDPARATSVIRYKSNLNSETPVIPPGVTPTPEELMKATVVTNIDAYDSLGNVHRVTVSFRRLAEERNAWIATATVEGADEANLTLDVAGTNPNTTNSVILRFDSDGAPVSIQDNPGVTGAPADVMAQGRLVATLNITFPQQGTTQQITLDFGTSGQFDGITQFAGETTTKAYEQDGYAMGYLESFIIDSSGIITGIYSNGNKAPIAQIALARFTNPQGLKAEGDNNFRATNNSGLPDVGAAGTGGRGRITPGALEMSNVDLAEQFTDMIVTQRGFQANSRIITTSDQMLQELLTLKR